MFRQFSPPGEQKPSAPMNGTSVPPSPRPPEDPYATEGNLNNHIGVPLTILAMPQDTEIAVIEMGANHPGEIAELCRIALPTFGLITNIGQAHLEGFGSFANIVSTKTALYEFVKKVHGKVFVNADNSILMNASCDVERFCYGSRENVFLRMTHLEEEQVKYTCCTTRTTLINGVNWSRSEIENCP